MSGSDANAKASGLAASDEDNDASSEESIPPAMTMTSDEVNFLVYRYLQENGTTKST